ncbi:MAG: spondin domain-containing protein [Salinirussus sp.]
MTNEKTRRRVLQATGTVAVLGLAGCGGGGGGGTETEGGSMTETEGGSMTETEGGGMTETEGGGMTETEGGSMTETESGSMNSPVTTTVRIENVAPTDFYGPETPTGGGIWITPGAYAIHTAENPIFTEGEAASVGLEALAEAGPPTGFPNDPGLIDELRGMTGNMGVVSAGVYTPENTTADPNDPTGEVPGAPPIAPGGAFEFQVEAEPGMKLSFASMFVPSNDVFVSPGSAGIELWPMNGQPAAGDVTGAVELWDAGTEPNAQPPGQGPDQAPAQSSPDQGPDEKGVVRRLSDVGDGYRYPDVTQAIRVSLTPGGSMSEDGNGSMTETDTMGDG